MSGARERILAEVRRSLHRAEPLAPSLRAALAERVRNAEPHRRPGLEGDMVRRFVEKADAAAAGIELLVSWGHVSRAVLDYLEREGLPREIVITADPTMQRVRWSNELGVSHRPAQDTDRVSVTTAFAGIAETGTVVLVSGALAPTTLNFLPEHHVVVLDRARIVPHLEDAWVLLRREHPVLPRTVNLVTGPSRTGDVELSLEFGAHGPRRLYVLLVGR